MAQPSSMKTCTKCKAVNPKNYKRCAFCHSALEPAQIDPSTNPSPWGGGGGYTTATTGAME